LSGKKHNAICKPFDVPTLKKIGQHYGKATINDVVLALSSVTLDEYMKSHGDLNAKSINMLTPFSLRSVPNTPQEHKLCNDFTVLCFTLALRDSFAEAIRLVSN
jgi:NRPS condensation-like uncharacterized protein